MSNIWKNNKLKYYRKANKMTQKKLAELVNVTQQAVQRWENGSREPTLQNLYDLCRILNISVDELINIKENNSK